MLKKKLLDRIKHISDCKIRVTIYMISKNSYMHVNFPSTPVDEVRSFINNMSKQGYKECSWLRWKFKVWWLDLKCWWNGKTHSETKIESKDGLTVNIGE